MECIFSTRGLRKTLISIVGHKEMSRLCYIILAASVAAPLCAHATAQFGEVLRYDGTNYI
jgi:hypothetical protein